MHIAGEKHFIVNPDEMKMKYSINHSHFEHKHLCLWHKQTVSSSSLLLAFKVFCKCMFTSELNNTTNIGRTLFQKKGKLKVAMIHKLDEPTAHRTVSDRWPLCYSTHCSLRALLIYCQCFVYSQHTGDAEWALMQINSLEFSCCKKEQQMFFPQKYSRPLAGSDFRRHRGSCTWIPFTSQ